MTCVKSRHRQLGVDETSFWRANRSHSTIYATGMVDLIEHKVIDMVRDNSAADLQRWTGNADPAWLAGIDVVATDLTESFRAGLSPHLDHARRVADPFHAVRVANRCVDKVRRRVQNETFGHRGRKRDPLYRIRKLLPAGSERLDERGHDRMLLGLRVGDPNDEVLGSWLAKESVRDVYLTDDPDDAAVLLDKAITGCLDDDVPEIQSLGRTLRAWRAEILAHHHTGASNGPTEGLNLCVKKVKRCGHGFTSFENYRLRVLLHTGAVTWPARPSPPRIRPHSPLERVEPSNRDGSRPFHYNCASTPASIRWFTTSCGGSIWIPSRVERSSIQTQSCIGHLWTRPFGPCRSARRGAPHGVVTAQAVAVEGRPSAPGSGLPGLHTSRTCVAAIARR